MAHSFEFDIALSFAGEDRAYVDQVASILRDEGVSIFYDKFEEVNLWGKNLYDYLCEIYTKKARFTVMFISESYAKKMWPTLERQAMQSRAFNDSEEYVLPARFDQTEIPGVLPTVGYISLSDRSPSDFAALIAKKLVSSGATIPSEQVRRDFAVFRRTPKIDPIDLNVRVASITGGPIASAQVAAMAENGTVVDGRTDPNGKVTLSIKTRRNYRLLIAHPNYPAALIEHVDPADDIEVVISQSENIGSAIFHSTGNIPGLKGQLNPIRDTSNRTYVYADNIAVDGGRPQPATFSLNLPMEMEDRDGAVFLITVKFIESRWSLIQFVKFNQVA